MKLDRDLTVLVLAPTGRDSSLIVDLLQHSGIAARAMDASDAVPAIETQRGGAFLVAEEALSAPFIAGLGEALKRQPSWADFPFLVLTSHGGETPLGRRREQERLPLLNHTLLERPIRPKTLITSIEAALRARARQYDVRQGIEELREASLALEVSEERNRLILQSTRDCIKLLDLEGNLLSLNAEGQERLGVPDFEAVRGRPWAAFWAEPYSTMAKQAMAEALGGDAGCFSHLNAGRDCIH